MSTFLIRVDNDNGTVWNYGERAQRVDEAIRNFTEGDENWLAKIKSVQYVTEYETYKDVIHFISGRFDDLFTQIRSLNEKARDLAADMVPHEDRLIDAETQWEIYHLAQGMRNLLNKVDEMCQLHHSYSEDCIDMTEEERKTYCQKMHEKRAKE